MVAGLAWYKHERLYRRLPVQSQIPIPPAVDTLANHTAGGQLRFRTNSTSLSIQVTLDTPASMDHMPATGQCGFDCYIEKNERLHFCSTTRFDHTKDRYEHSMMKDMTAEMREIVLNFPLYQGVKEIRLGIDSRASIAAPTDYSNEGKVIFYGTSITQGGCANRPGMVFTNILSRRFPLEFINLGFSGNGKGEPEMAQLIAEIEQPACLVLDYEGNCPSVEEMARTLPEFIRIYRSRHPKVPILVLTRPCYASDTFQDKTLQERIAMNQTQAHIVNDLRSAGDEQVYFQSGSELFGLDFAECTVDGGHPTDLGFQRMADKLTPVLADIFRLSGSCVTPII